MSCHFYYVLFLYIAALVCRTPLFHRIQNRHHAVPQIRQGIFHFRRNFGKHFSCQNAVSFHITQVRSQHFLRDTRHGFLQFSETFCTASQITKNQDFPLISDQHQCRFHRTSRQLNSVCHSNSPLNSIDLDVIFL